MSPVNKGFRAEFDRLSPLAIISRDELAILLNTTSGAISQMVYRNELPPKAFPNKRRCCWFVKDIKIWLSSSSSQEETANPEKDNQPKTPVRKTGRPRHA